MFFLTISMHYFIKLRLLNYVKYDNIFLLQYFLVLSTVITGGKKMGKTIYNVTFDMLNEEAQKRIISNNPTYYMLVEATTSQYTDVREFAVRSGRLSSEALSKMLENESDEKVSELILKYLVKSNITTRNIFSPNVLVRQRTAEDSETSSEDLTKMLQNEENSDVIQAIVKNPKFEKTPENMNILLNFNDDWKIRWLAAKNELTTTENLISRLKSSEDDVDVISAIFENLSEREIMDIPFSKEFSSRNVRKEYATRTKNPKYLFEALMEELNNADYMDFVVIAEICNNDHFVANPINSKIYRIFEFFKGHKIINASEFQIMVDMLLEKENFDKYSL